MKQLIACALVLSLEGRTIAQLPTSCANIGQRANSNGGTNSCPNVAGTPYASNFANTSYAAVPTGLAKTGNVTFTYAGTNTSLLPFAITKVWLTSGGTTIQTVSFGPASPPTISGNTTQVNYCFYGTNLPTAGTLSFQLTDPSTGLVSGICSYDASCNSNCTVTANPAALTLPVVLTNFQATREPAGVVIKWYAELEQNNKGFEIERSTGDSSFSTIGFVPSDYPGGNSNLPTTYAFTDHQPPNTPNVAYRLRQIDLDGRAVYSRVVNVKLTQIEDNVRIWSDGDLVYVTIASPAARGYESSLYDTGGKLLQKRHWLAPGRFTISGLQRGNIYYVFVRDDQGKEKQASAVYIQSR